MGASQSSGTGAESGSGNASGVSQSKRCYYDLLDVDARASDEEIKKAYRRKALELHPDRNFGNVEATTALFADVQTAYEVLSDPQERAWYDSHRDAILSDSQDGESPSQYTTTDDVLALVSKFNGRVEYSDKSTGFFGALNEFFAKLADEEAVASNLEGSNAVSYPDFGRAYDQHDSGVRDFYAHWSSFATRKSFNWKDKYRYADAPDRKIRRLMEKENRQFRDEAIREFNDAVRSLIAFVKKRDPRYQPNKQSEAERQRVLKDAATAQAARSRAANLASLPLDQDNLSQWARSAAEHDGNEEVDSEWDVADEGPDEEFECVLCNKTFKSEKQFEVHEKSKKHVKAAQQIKRQMQRENIDLDLDGPAAQGDGSTKDVNGSSEASRAQRLVSSENLQLNGSSDVIAEMTTTATTGAASECSTHEISRTSASNASEDSETDTDLDDDYAPRDVVAGRISGNTQGRDSSNPSGDLARTTSAMASQSLDEPPQSDEVVDDTSAASGPHSDAGKAKLGKAKQKRAKKAAASNTPSSASSAAVELRCSQCGTTFPSRNQLFTHLKELGHTPAGPGGGGKKGGKGKR